MGKSVADRFEGIALEDSFVCGVITDDDSLTLEMDFALQPGHPQYEGDGASLSHNPGSVRFGGLSRLSIDVAEKRGESRKRFAIHHAAIEGSTFRISCDWGDIELTARSVRLVVE